MKHKLVREMASAANITVDQASKAYDALLAGVSDLVKTEGKATLVGFGTFSLKTVAERTGKIPGTDQEYTSPARTVVKFKASARLNAAV